MHTKRIIPCLDVKNGRLKDSGRVGMLNAALRLKLFLDGRVEFEMDSETGVGTLVTIRIPLEAVRRQTDEEGMGIC